VERNYELNPLDDEEDFGEKLPEPESIKSFWVCCSGLAVLAVLASVGAFSITKFEHELSTLLSSFWKIQNNQVLWMAFSGVHAVFRASLIPSIVLGALVPILYWRGGLMQRFAISVAIAVTTMNLTTGHMGQWGVKVPIRQVIAILLCWMAMPAIFLWTPIKTRNLRMIVASCLLVLTLCLSILHMFEAPKNINYLYWESLYGAAFSYALIRRNWGRVAILESASRGDQIERTSTRTLLELMTVCGLACAASMYWSTSLNLGVFIQLGQAAVFGIACILASMACIRLVLHRSGKVIRKIFALGLLMNLLFCANSCVYFAVFDPWGTGNWRNLGFLVSSNEVSFAICITSFFASIAYIGFMIVVGCWLKWCGWQTQEQVGMSID